MSKKQNKKQSKKRSKKNIAFLVGFFGGIAAASYLISRKKKKSAGKKSIFLSGDKSTELSVIFNHALDSVPEKEGATIDIEAQLAKDLGAALEEILGASITVKGDSEENSASAYEIIVGETARAESSAFRSSLGFNEYGFAVIGNKIAVSGTNLTTTERAVELFIDYAKKNVEINEKSEVSLRFPANARIIDAADDWLVDIPDFENGTFYGTLDSDLGELVIRYTNTSADAFESYCKKLEANGYKLWQRNDIVGNLHAFYTGEKGLISVCYAECEGAVRIATSKAGEYELPESTKKQEYEKITDSLLVQLACDYTRHEYGMGYIVVLENGSFVIFDGGDNRDTYTFIDSFYDKLVSLNKRPDGKIVIEGWFISHTHIDHYGTFVDFCYKYGKDVIIKQVLHSTTSKNYEYHSVSPDRKLQGNLDKLRESVPGMKFVKVHSGMRFYIGNAEFEILHTPEDLYPQTPFYFNDTSITWRMSLCGQTSMWLGDIAQRGSGVMCSKYGEYLRSDIVQISHHGYVGATVELYDLVDGKIALWPINQRWYDIMIKPDFEYYAENIEAVNHAEEVLIAEEDVTLPLPYKTGMSTK